MHMYIICYTKFPIANIYSRFTGSTLELDEETVQGVLAACRQEIGCVCVKSKQGQCTYVYMYLILTSSPCVCVIPFGGMPWLI